MLVIACLIKLTSRGPVFFKQERVGKNGKVFKVIKFRSMDVNAEKNSGPVLSDINDQRITFLGNILRKTHLDELPQFFNVLNGTMSMIGPRPERPFFVDNFVRLIPFYGDRFVVKPGITGLAQVYGSYHSKAEEKLIFDLNYIHNLGLFLDIKLCFLTVIEAVKTFFKN
jgi:lipopolysaccharide/colanic/teichoic acid biosynthesis glycosyltransferase